MEEARQLQLSMLAKSLPQLPHLEIAVYSKPATEVGGDYYDFHLDGDGTLTIAIGDATGHGMKAGTMVSITKGLFKSLTHVESLREVFKKISAAIESMNLGTLFMALTLVRMKDSWFHISAAGMPPTFLYHSATKSVEEIAIKGFPLGGFPNFPYQIEEKQILPGD